MFEANVEQVQTLAECAELVMQRAPSQAVQIMEGVKILRPSSPEVAVLLGRAYAQTGHFDRAQTEFLRALALDPHQSYAEVCLAELMLRDGGRTDEAGALLLRAAE